MVDAFSGNPPESSGRCVSPFGADQPAAAANTRAWWPKREGPIGAMKLVRENKIARVLVSADQIEGEYKEEIDGGKPFVTPAQRSENSCPRRRR